MQNVLVNSYRFITPPPPSPPSPLQKRKKYLKIHEKDAICSRKHLKCKFWWLRYKITQKSASKDFIWIFPTYFSQIFLQHFSNRLYPNVKIVLAYFYIIKTTLRVLLTRFILYISLKLSDSLDFSNKSPCSYAKLRTSFFFCILSST